MTTHDCTANTAELKNTPYYYPVISQTHRPPRHLHVAEDSDDYDAAPMTD